MARAAFYTTITLSALKPSLSPTPSPPSLTCTAGSDRQASSRVIRLGAGGDVWRSSAGRDAGCYVGCLRYDDLHPAGGLQRRAAWAMDYFLGKIFER